MDVCAVDCPGCAPGGRDDEHVKGCDFGPDAWLTHFAGCRCPDCKGARDDMVRTVPEALKGNATDLANALSSLRGRDGSIHEQSLLAVAGAAEGFVRALVTEVVAVSRPYEPGKGRHTVFAVAPDGTPCDIGPVSPESLKRLHARIERRDYMTQVPEGGR